MNLILWLPSVDCLTVSITSIPRTSSLCNFLQNTVYKSQILTLYQVNVLTNISCQILLQGSSSLVDSREVEPRKVDSQNVEPSAGLTVFIDLTALFDLPHIDLPQFDLPRSSTSQKSNLWGRRNGSRPFVIDQLLQSICIVIFRMA